MGRDDNFLTRTVASPATLVWEVYRPVGYQILKAPSVSPSREINGGDRFGQGWKTSLNSACPDSGIQNSGREQCLCRSEEGGSPLSPQKTTGCYSYPVFGR